MLTTQFSERIPVERLSTFSLPGILFALTLAFGFWLSWAGKPYSGALFNAHKLIALGAIIVTAIRIVNLLHSMDSQFPLILLLAAAVLCVIALFASGALMSAGKMDATLMLTIHRTASVLLVLCCALAFFVLER
jgi:hypothetical protein